MTEPPPTILLSGATGYVGGRLGPRLLRAGFQLRCPVRSPDKLLARTWAQDDRVHVEAHDLADGSDEALERLTAFLRGAEAAYYLVHSMVAAGDEYADRDRAMATRFATAAKNAGVARIIYLGGLGELGDDLSEHLRSRREVEDALASSGVPVTTLRAAMIVGSGSASFEILRYLVERLPVMVTPRWVSTECQPIAIRNVLRLLIACLETPETVGRDLDIGGPEVMSYLEIMRVMAEERGLPRRWIIPVPVLTPRLSSLWIGLVTPVTPRIARPLAEGLRNRVVCRDDEANRLMPQRLLTVRESIAAALGRHAEGGVETVWSGAGPMPGDEAWSGGTVFTDERQIEIIAPSEAVFRAVCRVGGGHGWYAADGLWRLRGWLDQLVGGPGLRRGRRDPERIGVGEARDFWRVKGVREGRSLDLVAEMKLPGEAQLSFRVDPLGEARSRLVMTAQFAPKGLLGIAYWYGVMPLHGMVFSGMLRGIRRAAQREGLD
ncbi:MAG: SDR family oxidoreductase [Phycisphaerales bacterium JB059]